MTRSQRWALGLTSLGSLMVMLDMLVVTTALPTMRAHFGASVGQLEWTVNAFTLSFGVLLLPAAALGDRFGRRRLMAVGLCIFTAASASCALVANLGLLVAARAVQGAGSALVMALAMALLTAAFPPEGRARALGLFSGITGLATLGGPIVGGAVVQALSWQWIFWLNVPIGAVLVPLVALHLDESRGVTAKADWQGLALAAGGAFGLVYGLVVGGSVGWGSGQALASLGGGACLVAAFIAWELRTREPMLPAQLFARRGFSAGNLSGLLLYGAIYGTAFFMAQFLETGLRSGPLATGLRLMPWTATLFVVAPRAGALVDRFGERSLMVFGLGAQALGFTWVAMVARPDMPYSSIVAPLVLAGCGVSLAMPAAQNAVMGSVPAPLVGKASGTFNTLHLLGGTFGIAAAAAAFSTGGGYGSPSNFTNGFGDAMGACAALSLAAALVALAVPKKQAARTLSLPALESEPAMSDRLARAEVK